MGKLWMFTWNVRMGLSPPKIWGLCRKCCGCYDILDERKFYPLNQQQTVEVDLYELNKQLSDALDVSNVSVVANPNRPLDLLGFLGNKTLFLDKLEEKTNDQQQLITTNNMSSTDDEIELVLINKKDTNNDEASDDNNDNVEEILNAEKQEKEIFEAEEQKRKEEEEESEKLKAEEHA